MKQIAMHNRNLNNFQFSKSRNISGNQSYNFFAIFSIRDFGKQPGKKSTEFIHTAGNHFRPAVETDFHRNLRHSLG